MLVGWNEQRCFVPIAHYHFITLLNKSLYFFIVSLCSSRSRLNLQHPTSFHRSESGYFEFNDYLFSE